MSGNNDGWSFNRFNEYEAKLKGQKVEETTEEVVEEEALEEGKSERPLGVMHQFARGVKQERGAKKDEGGKYLRQQHIKKQNKKEADLEAHREKQRNERGLAEESSCGSKGYQKGGEVEGMHREADTGKVVKKAEIGKTYYPNQPKKKTSVTKKPDAFGGRFKKEELEATGLFTAEEIEALIEASSCGSKGYQKGGEVEEEGNSKPDYLDFDKDGNKKESMKKALKEKGAKKN